MDFSLLCLGLGRVSNNVVEAYALYEGICIEKERNISKIALFTNSMMVVQVIIKKISLEAMFSMTLFLEPCLSLKALKNSKFIILRGTLIPLQTKWLS
jgi:hypothetical protein